MTAAQFTFSAVGLICLACVVLYFFVVRQVDEDISE